MPHANLGVTEKKLGKKKFVMQTVKMKFLIRCYLIYFFFKIKKHSSYNATYFKCKTISSVFPHDRYPVIIINSPQVSTIVKYRDERIYID